MALNLDGKKAIVAEVSEVAKQSISLVIADYRGLNVSEITAMRAKARESGVYLKVIRNTLAKRALQDTDFECMSDVLVGPLIFGFAQNEPSAAARLFKDFTKVHKSLEVKALSVAGQFYESNHLDQVASLPTRQEALSQLACALLSPVTKLAQTLSEPHSQLARALEDYRTKKEQVEN